MTSPANQEKQPVARRASDFTAMASFIVSLVFPVAVVINMIAVVNYSFTAGRAQPFPYLALVYTALDYFAIPVIIFAIILGHIALVRADAWRRFATRGLIIAYASLAGIALLFVILIAASSLSAPRW